MRVIKICLLFTFICFGFVCKGQDTRDTTIVVTLQLMKMKPELTDVIDKIFEEHYKLIDRACYSRASSFYLGSNNGDLEIGLYDSEVIALKSSIAYCYYKSRYFYVFSDINSGVLDELFSATNEFKEFKYRMVIGDDVLTPDVDPAIIWVYDYIDGRLVFKQLFN